jgi:peroxiredoxin
MKALLRRLLRRRAPLFAVLVLAIALVGAAAWLLPATNRGRAPDVELALLDGRTLPLSAWRGQPLLLSFWSLTCRPCLEERPDLARFYEDLQPRGFEMIAVAMPYDPPLAVHEFNERDPSPYPVALDVEGRAAGAFGVDVIPVAVILDPRGRVVYRQTGKLDIERARRIIEPLLPVHE